jgi:hypothetical protein
MNEERERQRQSVIALSEAFNEIFERAPSVTFTSKESPKKIAKKIFDVCGEALSGKIIKELEKLEGGTPSQNESNDNS